MPIVITIWIIYSEIFDLRSTYQNSPFSVHHRIIFGLYYRVMSTSTLEYRNTYVSLRGIVKHFSRK